MNGNSKIESYMINLGLTFEEIDESSWLINDEEKGLDQVTVFVAEPLVIVRVSVMDVPKENREAFFEQLLTYNAADLVHGAYAIEDGKVVLVDTLEYDTMDIEEFQATLDAMGLALAQHFPVLAVYRE